MVIGGSSLTGWLRDGRSAAEVSVQGVPPTDARVLRLAGRGHPAGPGLDRRCRGLGLAEKRSDGNGDPLPVPETRLSPRCAHWLISATFDGA